MKLLLFLLLLLPAFPSRAPAQGNPLEWTRPGASSRRDAYRERVRDEVRQAFDRWHAAWEGDDASALAALYEDDAALFPADGAAFQGTRAIREHYAGTLPAASGLQVGKEMSFDTSGDMAYRALEVWYVVSAEGEEPQLRSGVEMVVFRRQWDGSWKIRSQLSTAGRPVS